MQTLDAYLDHVETQVRRDGFMTNALRRHLDRLSNISDDDGDIGQRIRGLVARYNAPYAMPHLISTPGHA